MKHRINANKTRSTLLTIISKESNTYIRNKCRMKINSKTTQEILSQFEIYEVKIDHSVITGIASRSTHTLNTFKQMNLTSRFDDDSLEVTSELNHYINQIQERKVLFSKKKLKKQPHNNVNNMSTISELSSISPNTERKREKKAKTYYDDKEKQRVKKVKSGMFYLRKIANKIKILSMTRENSSSKKQQKSTSPKSIETGYSSLKLKKKQMIHPHKKPMSMKISKMKRLYSNNSKKHSLQKSTSSTNNDYEFKINLLKVEPDGISDKETIDNESLTIRNKALHNNKKNNQIEKLQFQDSSVSDESNDSE